MTSQTANAPLQENQNSSRSEDGNAPDPENEK